MSRRAIGLALLLVLLSANIAAGSLLWRVGTVGADASEQLRNRIAREHARVCGNRLTYDRRLAAAAKYKAMDMGYRDYFSHAAKDGKRVWEFYGQVGIRWSLGAEIIAWNNAPAADSAKMAFDQFMGSTEHRRAIRHCGYRAFGVGSFQTTERKLFAAEFIIP